MTRKILFKKLPIILLLLISAGFVTKEIALILHGGFGHYNTDATTEGFALGAANRFLSDGLAKTCGLPTIPPFETETPIEKIRKSYVYTHFLPGPEYFSFIVFKIFGYSLTSIAWSRLVPMFFVLISILLFVIVCEKRLFNNWPWGKVILAPWLFSLPGIYLWAITHHGNAFSTAFIIFSLTIGLLAGDEVIKENRRYRLLLLASAFFVGFMSNFMFLEGAFVTFIAPIVGVLITDNYKNWREGLWLCFFTGCGLFAAWFIHFLQVAAFVGSLSDAWIDQIGTALLRAEDRQPPSRIQMIGKFSEYAGHHFRVGGLTMLFTGFFGAWLMFVNNARKRAICLSLFLALIFSYMFPMLMKHHSIIHSFRVPRIFVLMSFVWSAFIVGLAVNHIKYRGNVNSST